MGRSEEKEKEQNLLDFGNFLDSMLAADVSSGDIKMFMIEFMRDHDMKISAPLTIVFPNRNARISILPDELMITPVAVAPVKSQTVPFQSRLCSASPITGSYGCAIAELAAGKRVARTGWNGNGMYIFKFSPVHHGMEELTIHDREPGTTKPLLPFIMMKTADDMYVPWLASQTDMLATDWMVVG